MKKQSAGILLYKITGRGVEVLLVHPGGPFWMKKDAGAWSVPKGEFAEGEEAIAAARREFTEELGCPVPEGEMIPLGDATLTSGKKIYVWAMQSDADISAANSSLFAIEWPPKSGRQQEFPEIDKAEWFSLADAGGKIANGQLPFITALAGLLGETIRRPAPTDRQASLF